MPWTVAVTPRRVTWSASWSMPANKCHREPTQQIDVALSFEPVTVPSRPNGRTTTETPHCTATSHPDAKRQHRGSRVNGARTNRSRKPTAPPHTTPPRQRAADTRLAKFCHCSGEAATGRDVNRLSNTIKAARHPPRPGPEVWAHWDGNAAEIPPSPPHAPSNRRQRQTRWFHTRTHSHCEARQVPTTRCDCGNVRALLRRDIKRRVAPAPYRRWQRRTSHRRTENENSSSRCHTAPIALVVGGG